MPSSNHRRVVPLIAFASALPALVACAAPIPAGSRSIARLSAPDRSEVSGSSVTYFRAAADPQDEPPWLVLPMPEVAVSAPVGPNYQISVGTTVGMTDVVGAYSLEVGVARVSLLHGIGAGLYVDKGDFAPYVAPEAGVAVFRPTKGRPDHVVFGGLIAARSFALYDANAIGAPTTYLSAAFGMRRGHWSAECAVSRTFNDDEPAWEVLPRVTIHGAVRP